VGFVDIRLRLGVNRVNSDFSVDVLTIGIGARDSARSNRYGLMTVLIARMSSGLMHGVSSTSLTIFVRLTSILLRSANVSPLAAVGTRREMLLSLLRNQRSRGGMNYEQPF
jgi:hypothetical protein